MLSSLLYNAATASNAAANPTIGPTAFFSAAPVKTGGFPPVLVGGVMVGLLPVPEPDAYEDPDADADADADPDGLDWLGYGGCLGDEDGLDGVEVGMTWPGGMVCPACMGGSSAGSAAGSGVDSGAIEWPMAPWSMVMEVSTPPRASVTGTPTEAQRSATPAKTTGRILEG
jgi:hypothetical protein